MNSQFKAAFFDIDGTLLSHSTGEVPRSTKNAIARMRENGIRIIMCSGRHPSELKNLNIGGITFDGYVTTNGQIVSDENWRLIDCNPLPKEHMHLLADAFNKKEFGIQFCRMDSLYMNYVDDKIKRILDDIHTPLHEVDEYRGEEIFQAVAYTGIQRQAWIDEISKYFHVTRWHLDGIDIISPDGSKAWGMEAYIRHIGVDRAATIAFGDGENDLEMIRYAAVGVAMGNGSPILKSKADHVTDDIDSDGLYNACVHFGLV